MKKNQDSCGHQAGQKPPVNSGLSKGKWDIRAQREGPGKHSGGLTLWSTAIGLCVKNGSEETAGLYTRTSLVAQFRRERLFKKIQCQRQEQRILKYEGVLAPR